MPGSTTLGDRPVASFAAPRPPPLPLADTAPLPPSAQARCRRAAEWVTFLAFLAAATGVTAWALV